MVAFARIILNIANDKGLGKKEFLINMAFFPIGPGISGFLQFAYPRLPAACVAMSLTTLILYLLWTDQLISLDPLTGLNNRKQFVHSFENLKKSYAGSEKICLYLIDANHFKGINDTYGHLQGDRALKLIAEALRLSCKGTPKSAVIARYGGDEFVILTTLGREDESADLKQRIIRNLDTIVARENLPFELTVSIGAAFLEKNETLKELMEKADDAMYMEKKH